MYALVRNNAIVLDRLPRSGVWNDGNRDWDLRPMSDAQLAALGWLPIVTVERPADTATHTSDYAGLAVVGGQPTQTWTVRPWTADERAALTAAANLAALTDPTGLEARLDRLDAYNTDPDIGAALARANSTAPTTQELNRLLKVMLRRDQRQTAAIALLARVVGNLLDDVSDTVDAP
jgi:hypothetical protein